MIVGTIIARNYFAHARVLGRSLAEHHDGRTLRVLVIDGEIGEPLDASDEPFDLVLPSELPLEPGEFEIMAAIYDATELATAVKPALLRQLLQSHEVACYLDPDIEIFGSLEELDALAREREIVLTPHALEPLPDDGKKPTPDDIASAGVFNLGFLAVSRAADPFLVWWDRRLRRDCLIDFEQGLFVDQRLLDVVPAYYPHVVLKDATYNVAYWNLHERSVAKSTTGGYEVDGRPLRFYHYSGYTPGLPDVLTRHGGDRPRTVLREDPVLAELFDHYRTRLLEEGYAWQVVVPYGFASAASGRALDRRTRRRYREGVLGGATLPSPFEASDAWRFESWLQSIAPGVEPLAARQRAQELLDGGNRVVSSRPWLRPLHGAIGRLLRHHDLHRRQVDAALLEAIAELEDRVRRVARGLDD